MPRRKQDCPKRMKWELENQARLAKAGPGGAGIGVGVGPSAIASDEIADADEPMQITPEDPDEDESMSASDDDDTGSGEWSPKSEISPRNNVPKRVSPLNGNSNNSSRFNINISHQQPIGESPLDLSVSQPKTSPPTPSRKHKPSLDVRAPWNGSMLHPNPDLTSKALEKMSELSRVGALDSSGSPNVKGSTSSWQAQWLAQSACGTKDVLKCVCCRLTFPSLSALSAHMKDAKHGPPLPSNSPKSAPPPGAAAGNHTRTTSPNNDSLLLKETVHLPRKLVRGQDVWLGKGAEQTRQILKCMWCGQSFRSLAEMTSHMQQTQHYTNIISQEQLISWRSHEDKSASTTSHVSAVLTCKVCDQAFSSLKELSNHMVKNSHYKEHIMRSITESGSRRRQSREKRKKSLPVRKLLELERASTGTTKKEILISCEKCAEKVPASTFVEHLRVCEKSEDSMSKNRSLKSSTSPHDATIKQRKNSTDKDKDADDKKEPSSVLNAIEKMIEKSFDYQAKGPNNASTGISSSVGTSILKRLGIDESVDYTKPLVDPTAFPTTMHLRSTLHRPKSASSEPSEQRERTPSSLESPQNSVTEEVEDKVLLEDGPEEQIQRSSPRNKTPPTKMSSLSALNSMFELIGGAGGGQDSTAKSPPSPGFAQVNRNQQHSSPISALQKFCDTRTESTTASSSRPASTSSSHSQSPASLDTSGILGLNWSTGDGDNMFKCNFCETSFMSKGAYRHHLAKMHFVKDDKLPGGGVGGGNGNGGSGGGAAKDEPSLHADSPASKFIKYSELAKQLSSK